MNSRVALLALPSICFNLCLDPTSTQSATRSNTNIYQDFLRVLQLRYEGTDRALEYMSKLMKGTNVKDATSPSTIRSGSEPTADSERVTRPRSSFSRNATGIDIVTAEPRKYVQICYTLDFFLCHGRMPLKEDIPAILLPRNLETAQVERNHHNNNATTRLSDIENADQIQPSDDIIMNQATTSDSPNDWASTNPFQSGNDDHPLTLMDDPLDQIGTNPDGFSFENFMTDGPFSGIEQLQNMLETYPDWL